MIVYYPFTPNIGIAYLFTAYFTLISKFAQLANASKGIWKAQQGLHKHMNISRHCVGFTSTFESLLS